MKQGAKKTYTLFEIIDEKETKQWANASRSGIIWIWISRHTIWRPMPTANKNRFARMAVRCKKSQKKVNRLRLISGPRGSLGAKVTGKY